jgi:Tfp pilus assembly protein PilX
MKPANARRRAVVAASRQRGIIVFVALIATVLLSLAAVGLMRTVHTSTMVVGNLSFRQAAIAMSTAAVEKAVYDMFQPGVIADLRNHDLARNYYAFVQAGENGLGVPVVLQTTGAYPVGFQSITDGAGNTARYVIERMCLPSSIGKQASGIECEMIPPKQSFGTTGNKQYGIPLPRVPYYRLTVRVDGPNNSVSFSQAMLR